MADIEIKRLTEQDYSIIIDIWKKSGLAFRPSGRDGEKNVQEQLRSGLLIILGATIDNEIVGVVMITHDGRKGWINRLAVIPSARNKGVAKRLIEESEKIFMKLGFEVFGVLVEADSLESKRLFTKHGYVEEKEISYFTKRLRKEA